MRALDELLARWRANPDGESTIALLSCLGSSGRDALVREVGDAAASLHSNDCSVMLAAGRMYLDAGMLDEAQAALVAAGNANPREPQPYRFLGEVLLRRGDAVRALRLLEKALEFGDPLGDAGLWLERAAVFVGLQRRVGMHAVAAEVERTLRHEPSVPPIPPSASAAVPAGPRATGRAPPLPMQAVDTLRPAPPSGGPRSRSDPPPVRARAQVSRSRDAAELAGPTSARFGAESPTFPPDTGDPDLLAAARSLEIRGATSPGEGGSPPIQPHAPWLYEGPTCPPSQPRGSEPSASDEDPTRILLDGREAVERALQDPGLSPGGSPRREPPAPGSSPAAELFEELARVGVFERSGGAPAHWERAPRVRTTGSWVLPLATVMILGCGVMAHRFASDVKARRVERAHRLSAEVEQMLENGQLRELRGSDVLLRRVFDLDPSSERGAALWLENRVLRSLLLHEPALGIDGAVLRARRLGLPEESLAYGSIASLLAEGDVAGAAALVASWDARARDQPMYQLTSGVVLEVAGDARAAERYRAAAGLDPKLTVADVLLTRLVLLERGAPAAAPLLGALETKLGVTPVTRALRTLAAALSPEHAQAAAPLSPAEQAELPAPLAFVPHLADAVQAIERDERAHAVSEVQAGFRVAATPAVATEFGVLALRAGDDRLAGEAALSALRLSPMYPGARVLAARLALLGGDFSQVEEALAPLDRSNAGVARVRVALAYERLDVAELERSLALLGGERVDRELSALRFAPTVLAGAARAESDRLQDIAVPAVLWGELVAVDGALDQGNLELARTLVRGWPDDLSGRPCHAARLARLQRYLGKAEDAAGLSAISFEVAPDDPRVVIEYALARAAIGRARELSALSALPGGAGGWLRQWLDVFALGASGYVREATVKAATLPLPAPNAPAPQRVLVGRALALAKDLRAAVYVREQQLRTPGHLDLVMAADELRRPR